MPNITTQEKIVKEITNIAPVPNHDVIVFKLVGDGKQYYSSLQPNEKFKKKSWLDKNSDLTGYAVSRDTNLNYEFSDKFRSGDQKGSFTINFIMVYRVSDPLTIVEKLNDDPLKRLKDEVTRILGGTVAGLGWTVIIDNSQDIESIALQYESLDKSNSSGKLLPTNWERLKDFAKDLGIELNGIRFSLTLPEQSAEIQERLILDREKNKDIQHQARLVEEDRKAEFANRTAYHNENLTNQLHDNQLAREFKASVVKDAARAISQATSDINSVSDLTKAAEQLPSIQNKFAQLAGATVGNNSHGTPVAITNNLNTLAVDSPLMLSSPEASYVAQLLIQTFQVFGKLKCEPQTKKRFLACILHLLGELSLGNEANEEIVGQYSSEFELHFRSLYDVLDNEQIEFMNKLQDVEALRMRLT